MRIGNLPLDGGSTCYCGYFRGVQDLFPPPRETSSARHARTAGGSGRRSSRHSMLLSLSDDELHLVHEAVRFKALASCVRCCKRLRTAAMASGRLALLAASVGDLESVKWAFANSRQHEPTSACYDGRWKMVALALRGLL